MTGAEMITAWKIGFDVIASSAAPGFTDTEIYSLLNKSQDYVILELHKNKDFLSLQSIINDSGVSLTGPPYYNQASIQLSSLGSGVYWLYIKSWCDIDRTAIPTTGFISSLGTSSTNYVTNDLVSIEKFWDFRESVFNKYSIFKHPKAAFNNNYLNVLADYYTTISDIRIIYVRKPLPISGSQSSELQGSLHRIIVDQAIKFAQESIFSQLPNKQ